MSELHGLDFSRNEQEVWNEIKSEMLYWAKKIIPSEIKITKVEEEMFVQPRLDNDVVCVGAAEGMPFGDQIAYIIDFTNFHGNQKVGEIAKKLRKHDMECITRGRTILAPDNSWLSNVMELFVKERSSSASVSR